MKNSFLLFIVIFASIAALKVSAQSTTPPPPPTPPTPVPIDGGLSAIIIGCVGYGAKKLNDRRKANKVE